MIAGRPVSKVLPSSTYAEALANWWETRQNAFSILVDRRRGGGKLVRTILILAAIQIFWRVLAAGIHGT